MATIEDFQALDMRVGRIVDVRDLPEARKPSFRLKIDFGSLGTRESVAAAKTDYAAEDLMHRQVVCVFNLPPRRVAGVQSEVLVLAATHADGTLRLLIPDPEAELGSHIT
ncbi:MAG: tRNA-binding protein [Chloroflexi bacterium]|nr:MAG: tRNA-binding protein [Chloroflexota bacterium]TMF19103.1 MAG: tRNA-binding protein [Chloroflexota bacterium]TMF98776.1 MAG: tRNA-binding protein [Chloroflexota bacterium]